MAVIRELSITRRAGFIFYRSENCNKLLFTLKAGNTGLMGYGLRRSTIIRSLLRFFRVLAPSVGNPHGV